MNPHQFCRRSNMFPYMSFATINLLKTFLSERAKLTSTYQSNKSLPNKSVPKKRCKKSTVLLWMVATCCDIQHHQCRMIETDIPPPQVPKAATAALGVPRRSWWSLARFRHARSHARPGTMRPSRLEGIFHIKGEGRLNFSGCKPVCIYILSIN